jgi:hypothetical protein
MLDPINARFASSCSKKGIKDAEIPAIWLGAIRLINLLDLAQLLESHLLIEQLTLSVLNVPSSAKSAFACAIILDSSSSAFK